MFKHLRKYRVVPMVLVTRVNDARSVCQALIDGGLPIMELMFRKHSDSKIIKAVVEEFPEFHIGVGGILNKDLLLRAIEAKADFTFAPGVNIEMIKEAISMNLSFAPGICTPTDIEIALLNGVTNFQFFPAEQFGGARGLKILLEPFEHLGVEVFVKGGIILDNMISYLRNPNVVAVSSSWIATPELIQTKNWKQITKNAQETVKQIKNM